MFRNERLSILCPNCRKLISRDVGRCPYCGMPNPGSRWNPSTLLRNLIREQEIIRIIIGTNIIMFVLSLLLNPEQTTFSMNPLYFLSPDTKSLFLLGATGTIPVIGYGRIWTLVAANFLHGGILHITFNMIAFKQLAPLTIEEYGASRTVLIYLGSGVVGFLVSVLAGVPFTIGASAAICGLMGAALYFGRSRGGLYGQLVYRQIGGWAIALFIFGFIVPGINNWGHGGGMAAGLILGFLLGYKGKRSETSVHRYLAAAGMVLTAGILLWAVLSTIFLYLLS
jgi:rhomboid protease GluP